MGDKTTVFARLKDRGTIFHDASQDKTVTGTQVAEFKRTGKVVAAIKNGLLVEVEAPKEAKEAKKAEKENGGDKGTGSANQYKNFKKSELIEALTTRGIEHDPEATNAVLVELLEKADAEAKSN